MGEFDLHIVGNGIPDALTNELGLIGYSPRQVIGGDERVRMESLFTNKCADSASADSLFNSSVDLIRRHPSFVGYIEEEATTQDLVIQSPSAQARKTMDRRVLDLELTPETAGDRMYKRCDIHATDVGGDQELRSRLIGAGFYFIELLKPALGRATVFTMQFERMADGERVWEVLKDYLLSDSGFVGSLKLESTVRMQNFGFALPPIVLSERKSGSTP